MKPIPRDEVMTIFEVDWPPFEIAERFGISQQHVSRIKQGRHIYSKKLYAVMQQLRFDYPGLSRKVIVHTIIRVWRDYLSEENLYAEASRDILDYLEDITEA